MKKTILIIFFITIFVSTIIGLWISKKLEQNLSQISDNISEKSQQVESKSEELKLASIFLAEASQEQSAALEETTSSLYEIDSTVKVTADTASEVLEFSESNNQKISDSKNKLEEIHNALIGLKNELNHFQENSKTIEQKLNDIAKQTTEIGQKTQIINDITFQTKILSFNASVEAARAGENGKGFAVVAEEIGKLAKSSSEAAEEINRIISVNSQEVQSTIEHSQKEFHLFRDKSSHAFQLSEARIDEFFKIFDEIQNSASELQQKINSITEASRSQAIGIEQINKAMQELNDVNHKNADASNNLKYISENIFTAGNEMKKEASHLDKLVNG